jgi:hypothetical protein
MAGPNHRALTGKPMDNAPFGKTAGGEFANDSITRDNRDARSLHPAGRATGRKPTVIDLHSKKSSDQSRGNYGVARNKLAAAYRMADHAKPTSVTTPRRASR